MVLNTDTPAPDARGETDAPVASLVWGKTVFHVHDAALAAQVEAEAQASPPDAQPGRWDYPFTALKHLDNGEPGVRRQSSSEAACRTLRMFLGLEMPFAIRFVDKHGRKRAIVVIRTRIVPVRDEHAGSRQTWLFTGYVLGTDGLLRYGINTFGAADEEVFVRGLDGEWRAVEGNMTGGFTQ
ncbi:hypothetical protein PQR33_36180 [Paraburkholderia sediminicola]|uniref:hypothetical protein n=1 Tax=Paraburkholderia sediminicola TaxID=458836 RepID=UPI0038BD3650